MLFFTILRLSLYGSALAAALLLLRPVLRRHIPHAVSYYLWLIVLLRLCVPVGWTLPVPDWTAEPVQHITIPVQQNDAQPVTSPLPPSESVAGTDTAPPVATINAPQTSMQQISIWNILFLIWCGGTTVCALRYLIGYRRFVRHILCGTVPTTLQASDVWGTLPHNPHIRLLCSTTAQTPLLMGAVRPTVVLPAGITDTAVLRDILRHELVHARRGDVLYKWFVAAVSCVHWFNPLMIAVRREIGRACELSCDAAVLRRADSAARRRYGETLLSIAESPRGAALAAMLCEETTSLKERLVSIVKHQKITPAALLLSLLLIAALGGCALVNGTQRVPSAPSYDDTALRDDVTLYDLDGRSVAIPNAILDQLYVKPGDAARSSGPSLSVYEKKSYDDTLADYDVEGGGFLFAIDCMNQAQYEELLSYDPAGSYTFARDDDYYYVWLTATDVQFYRSGLENFTEETMKPWNDLYVQVEEIRDDFIARNRLTPYTDGEFFDRDFVYDGEHLYVYYRDETLNIIRVLTLSQPVKQGTGGIWCVESWRALGEDVSTDTAYYFPGNGERSAEEVYTELQAEVDAGHRPDLLDPLGAALNWLNNYYYEGTDVTAALDQLSIIKGGTPGGNVQRRAALIWNQSGTLELLDEGGDVEQTMPLQQDSDEYLRWYRAADRAFGNAIWMKAETVAPSGRALRYTAEDGGSLTLYETGTLHIADDSDRWFYATSFDTSPYTFLRGALES